MITVLLESHLSGSVNQFVKEKAVSFDACGFLVSGKVADGCGLNCGGCRG
jgi:hypothetical protein